MDFIRESAVLFFVKHERQFRSMAHRLDAVSVGIQHKCAVVVGVILRPKTGRAVVTSAFGERRRVKLLDGTAA